MRYEKHRSLSVRSFFFNLKSSNIFFLFMPVLLLAVLGFSSIKKESSPQRQKMRNEEL
jgi:hypothetical protein